VSYGPAHRQIPNAFALLPRVVIVDKNCLLIYNIFSTSSPMSVLNGGNLMVFKGLWERLDEICKDVVLYLLHVSPPVSIDMLMALSGASAGTVLRVMEELKKKRIVGERKGYEKGLYFVDNDQIAAFMQDLGLEDDAKHIRRIRKRVIDFYSESLGEGREKILVLANLYQMLGDIEEGLSCIKEAADILFRSGDNEKAAGYYDRILQYFENKELTSKTATIFVESVLAKLSSTRELGPARENMALIAKAEQVAERHKEWKLVALIKLELITELHVAGRSGRASRSISDFRGLAGKIGDPRLLRRVALSMTEHLFYKGRILEATQCYGQATGNLEEFGNDEQTLRVGALVGWCHVMCGKIARGIGMIEAVRMKAQLLDLQTIVFTAGLLHVHALLDIKKIAEAEALLNSNKLSLSLGNIYDHLMLWTAFICRAYILYAREDYEGAFECHKKAAEYLPSLGWLPGNNPWGLEYLSALESRGFVHEKMTFEAEVEQLIKGHNIYMKGFAFRYRALKNMETQRPRDTVLADLKRSEKCLNSAGAGLELARTRLALGNCYLEEGDAKTGRSYVKKAWRFFSTIDKNLFPADLMAILPKEQKMEFMMGRVVDINESLGTIRDTSSFLQRVINIAMDFTMATRGAFVVLQTDEPQIITSRNIDSSCSQTEGFRAIKKLVADAAREGTGSIVLGFEGNNNDGSAKTLRKAGINSFICVPAKLGGSIYGYLCLSNLLGGKDPDNWLPFLNVLCSQIAVGFFNISMYNEMKELKDRFENETIFYKQEMGIATPLEMIIGQSESIANVKAQVRQVAPTSSSVLILGETGVGKELVAKAIHSLSARKDGPFIPINLGVLPQELVASELFGHEKGAFTGASESQKGRFELADGGTIFLDEIGDLSPHVQVKLLRVLQEGALERLGSAKTIESNFRVVAATNKNLRLEVEKGGFRQDLYYRLNVFPIYVPPLRERKEDILLLAHHFLDKYCRKLGKRIRRIPPGETKKLLDCPWPGNVRELKHFVERAVILSDGLEISFSAFEYASTNGIPPKGFHNPVTLFDFERGHIENVLRSANWKVSGSHGAASMLGLKASTLFARMKKLGIKRHSAEFQ
jgi:transcriptional regulator with GAF, ATPase, and Fis domain/tetratricopeptide (TPR) repeat protein